MCDRVREWMKLAEEKLVGEEFARQMSQPQEPVGEGLARQAPLDALRPVEETSERGIVQDAGEERVVRHSGDCTAVGTNAG